MRDQNSDEVISKEIFDTSMDPIFKFREGIPLEVFKRLLLNLAFLEAIQLGANKIEINKVEGYRLIRICLLKDNVIIRESICNSMNLQECVDNFKKNNNTQSIDFNIDKQLEELLSYCNAPQYFINAIKSITVKEYCFVYEEISMDGVGIRIAITETG